MQKLCSGMVLAALALSLTTAAHAQRRTTTSAPMGGAKHELGVDVGVAYAKPSGADGGIEIATPLDVRFGIVSNKELMWEPHLALVLSSVGGGTNYSLAPSINALYSMSPGRHRRGMFLTGGAGLLLGQVSLGGASVSGTSIQLGGGVGWRKPYGSGAWRYELGFRWTSDSDISPSTIEIGGRIGISLWH